MGSGRELKVAVANPSTSATTKRGLRCVKWIVDYVRTPPSRGQKIARRKSSTVCSDPQLFKLKVAKSRKITVENMLDRPHLEPHFQCSNTQRLGTQRRDKLLS